MSLNQQNLLMENQRRKFADAKMQCFLPMRRGRFADLKEIDKGNINARGWYYMFQTEAPRNFSQSPFASSEGGIFKDAGGVRYLVQNVLALTHRARITYTDQVKLVNNNSERQEIPHKVIDDLDKKHLQGMENAMARQFWGDRTNEVARVSAINTGTRTVTCNNAGNLFGTYLIEPGDKLEVFSSAGTQRVGSTSNTLVVESVSLETKSFVYRAYDYDGTTALDVTISATIVATDRIYPEGGKDNGLNGIRYIFANSGPYQGLSDRTVNKQTTGLYLSAGSNPLSVAFLRKMTGEVRFTSTLLENTKSKWNFWVSTQKDAFASLGDALQPTNQDGDTLNLGRTGNKFENIEFMFDPYVARDAVSLLDDICLDKGVLADYAPVGGDPVMKQVNGELYDIWSIPYRGYWNMGCETPRQAGIYADGFTTTGYSMGFGV